MVVPDGPYKVEGEGWWNNSSNSFCTRVDCDNPEAAIKAHLLTNQLGLDGDNTSVVIGWAFECYEKGLLYKEDTDGLELEWGNHDAVLADRLGKGSEEFAVHIKGQDSVDGIRISKGWGFGVVTSTAAGRHLRGAVHSFDPERFLSYEGVPWRVYMQEQYKAVLDMTGTCLYNNGLLSWETDASEKAAHHFAELISSLTGMDLDVDRLMRIGLQVHNLEKAFNTLHGGFTRRDDYPPRRYWTEPVKLGPYAGERIDHEAWERMLDEYYSLHGWDKETGLQTRQALEALDLLTV
jgi:aldehyde:ferredoxin oxidoreductase